MLGDSTPNIGNTLQGPSDQVTVTEQTRLLRPIPSTHEDCAVENVIGSDEESAQSSIPDGHEKPRSAAGIIAVLLIGMVLILYVVI
jgi:hypothetical protein